MEESNNRKIRRGAEEAERCMKWHGEHIPYTVYGKLPSFINESEICENEEYQD